MDRCSDHFFIGMECCRWRIGRVTVKTSGFFPAMESNHSFTGDLNLQSPPSFLASSNGKLCWASNWCSGIEDTA